jgi:hypothetical protein
MANVPKRSTQERYKSDTAPDKEGNVRILILIGIMLVLIVAGVALLVFLLMGRVIPPLGVVFPNITPGGNQPNATAGCGDECLFQQALNATSPGFCDQMTNATFRNDCYIALSNVSLDACTKIQDHASLEGCIEKFAVMDNMTDICLYLPEPAATACMAMIDPCYQKTGTGRSLCLALEKKNSSLCGSDKECIYNYSLSTGESIACDALPEQPEQYACNSVVLGKDECSSLTGAGRDLCYEIYAQRTNNEFFCNSITPNGLYALDCVSYFVSRGADYGTCDNLLTLNNRWSCYTNYSLGTGNVSGCVAIDPLASSFRFSCLYQFAKKFGDPSACDLINETYAINTCYVGSIMNNTNLDYTHCQAVGQVIWRNKCYTQSALQRNDPSLCNLIQTENEKASCINTVQNPP